VLAVVSAAVDEVDPARAVRAHLPAELPASFASAVVLALGKAAVPMARGALAVLGGRVRGGVVVTKDGHADGPLPPLEVRETAHPVPDARSVAAGERLLAAARDAGPDDLVLVLVSGGASALAEAPADGVTLADIARTTDALLKSGAAIGEINAARTRLSKLKGGGLARACRARMLTLLVSDVPGDDPAVIGSGPTCVDGARMVVVASLAHALDAAERAARARGFVVGRLSARLDGEARYEHERVLAELDRLPGRALALAGGETWVRVTGSGEGGRNQELAAAAIPALATRPGTVLAAIGTDGTDGPTSAAGGIVDSTSLERTKRAGVDVIDYLARNDSGRLLEILGDRVTTGPTGTNVGDLVLAARANAR
jgi:glycerate 2-kinase